MLAIGGDDRIVRGEGLHRSDRHRFLADVEMEEAADLSEAVELDGLLLETADPEHLMQELLRVITSRQRRRLPRLRRFHIPDSRCPVLHCFSAFQRRGVALG